MRIASIVLALVLALSAPARADLYRSISVTDGDTIHVPGGGPAGTWIVRAQGYDTPELSSQCPAERALAARAKMRVISLLSAGVSVTSSLRTDRDGRFLAVLTLPNGSDLGAILISEGLARPYDGTKARGPWCDAAGKLLPQPGQAQ